jgi:hypothetical protein
LTQKKGTRDYQSQSHKNKYLMFSLIHENQGQERQNDMKGRGAGPGKKKGMGAG